MSVVLKRLFVKRRKPEGPLEVVPRAVPRLDKGAPNDDSAYAQKIEDRIVLRLVAPKDEVKAEVEHVERKEKDVKSQRLNDERIQKMVQLDELFFKYAAHNIGMFRCSGQSGVESDRDIFFSGGAGQWKPVGGARRRENKTHREEEKEKERNSTQN